MSVSQLRDPYNLELRMISEINVSIFDENTIYVYVCTSGKMMIINEEFPFILHCKSRYLSR